MFKRVSQIAGTLFDEAPQCIFCVAFDFPFIRNQINGISSLVEYSKPTTKVANDTTIEMLAERGKQAIDAFIFNVGDISDSLGQVASIHECVREVHGPQFNLFFLCLHTKEDVV